MNQDINGVKIERSKTTRTRHFNGKLENFEDKMERKFEQKRLKNYLRGTVLFPFGGRTMNERGQLCTPYFSVDTGQFVFAQPLN